MPLIPAVGRRQPTLRIAWWLICGFLVLGIILHLLPFYYMITTSLKSGPETLSDVPTLWPQEPTLSAWRLVFTVAASGASTTGILDYPFSTYFMNSLIIAAATLGLSLPITSLAAYASSKLVRGPMARWSFLFFIGTLMVPAAVTLIPSLLLTLNFPFATTNVPVIDAEGTQFPTIRIWNTPLAVILPMVFNAFNFLLFKGFFDGIPDSILQAARVDGGSELNIFRRIVLPMCIPVYAVATWMMFSTVWDNSYLWQSLTLESPQLATTAMAVQSVTQKFQSVGTMSPMASAAQNQATRSLVEAGLSWNGLMVLGILQSLPIFLMFIVCREYLLRGIKIRGFK